MTYDQSVILKFLLPILRIFPPRSKTQKWRQPQFEFKIGLDLNEKPLFSIPSNVTIYHPVPRLLLNKRSLWIRVAYCISCLRHLLVTTNHRLFNLIVS